LRAGFGPVQQQAQGLFGRTAPLFDTLGTQLGELRPGFGRLTEARVGGVRTAASQAIGNAKSAFAKRNILGSSFAQSEIGDIQRRFVREEVLTRAEAFVQEQEAQRQIIGQIGELVNQDRFNIAANIGVLGAKLGLTSAESAILGQEITILNQQAAVLDTAIKRDLAELGIASGTITQFESLNAQVAQSNARLAAEEAAARGEAVGAGLQSLGDFFFGKDATFGGVFGGGA